MAYNLRKRNLLNTRGTYAGSGGSDNESHDSTHSDPDYVRATRRPRPNQNNAGPSAALQRSAGVRIPDSGGGSSSRNPTGAAKRRRPGRPPKARAGRKEDRQGVERQRKRKRMYFSQSPEVIVTRRTVLSWLISLGRVRENEVVWYIDAESGNVLGEGRVKRLGIFCSCCCYYITVGQFEIHSGCSTGKPYQHIVLAGSQRSLLACQIEACEALEEEEKRTNNNNTKPEETADDENDDACMICADGGDLVCCESCPSTFHPKCIFMENIPQGEWLCSYCVCKFCGCGDGFLRKCSQCEKQYHSKCGGEELDVNSLASSCGSSCRNIYEGLEGMVGVRNDLHDGLCWTLLQRTELPLIGSSADDAYNKVQSNCKIAVAWQVLNECFLSTVDRHTKVNIGESIVFNRGSNLTPRINFSGFYTAVLETKDEEEIICAASIRVHGKRLAEMPFIGTRAEYRFLGMARILENCIESALCALEIEKLVIPSVEQLVGMWTRKYFFCRIEEDRLKKELSRYNTVVFPSTVVKMQKNLRVLPDLNMGHSEINQ